MAKSPRNSKRIKHSLFAKFRLDKLKDRNDKNEEEDYGSCLIVYGMESKLRKIADVVEGTEGLIRVNGSIDYQYGECEGCGLRILTGPRHPYCPSCGRQVWCS